MKKTITLIIIFVMSGALVYHFYPLDGIVGSLLSLGRTHDTAYSPGYSDRAFRGLKRGDDKKEVLNLLGSPLTETWKYDQNSRVFFEKNIVYRSFCYEDNLGERMKKIKEGMRKKDVLEVLGTPPSEIWFYSRSPGDTDYKCRVILLENGKVFEKHHEYYVD